MQVENANEISEGQEAVWVEETMEEFADENLPKNKKKNILKRKKKKPQKKVLTTKTKVVLPDFESDTPPIDPEQKKNDQEAFANLAEYARQLLEQGLSPNNPRELDEVENKKLEMIEMAFRYAAEARLTSDLGSEEERELIVAQNSEKGKAAATEVRHILSNGPSSIAAKGSGGVPARARSLIEKDGNVELMNRYADSAVAAKLAQDVDEFALEAREALELILQVDDEPNALAKKPSELSIGIDDEKTNENTPMSTIGFDNTFDKCETMTISSLNEIMDGPISPESTSQKQAAEEKEKAVGQEKKKLFKMFRRQTKKNKESSSAKVEPQVDNDKPLVQEKEELRYFDAKIVGEDEDEVEPDPLFDLAELEMFKNADRITGSRLKEAIAMDRTESLNSWNGVPLHEEAQTLTPDRIKKRDKMKDSVEMTEKERLPSIPPRNPDDILPKFIPAPKGDPAILTARSWSLLMEEEEKQNEKEENDLLTTKAVMDVVDDSSIIEVVHKKGKQKKMFGFKFGARKPDEDEVSMTSFPDDVPPEILENANMQHTPPRNLTSNLPEEEKLSPISGYGVTDKTQSIDNNIGNDLPTVVAISSSSDLADDSIDNEMSQPATEISDQENIVPQLKSLTNELKIENEKEDKGEKEKEGSMINEGRWSAFGMGKNRKKSFKI